MWAIFDIRIGGCVPSGPAKQRPTIEQIVALRRSSNSAVAGHFRAAVKAA
jgi:hypothetical protein